MINIEEEIDFDYLSSYDQELLKRSLLIPLKSDGLYKKCYCCEESNLDYLQSNQLLKYINIKREQIEFFLSDFDFRKKLYLLSKSIVFSKSNNDYLKQFVSNLLSKAILLNASDIHIESLDNKVLIRFRIDGILKSFYSFSKELSFSLSSYIKLLSKLDITQNRVPMDGRFTYIIENNKYDFRVSTMPTIYGESLVVRVLDNENVNKSLNQLGFTPSNYKLIKEISCLTEGLVLITGPTGSGKSTTLYSLINEFNFEDKKIITIEDPVEYKIEGIQQIEVNKELGLDFSVILKNILRQDPDVILIGEIRDKESLQIALQASLTGHLVLASIHANSSIDTLSRLVDLNADFFLLSSSLRMIISQRLILMSCKYCNTKGCIKCNFRGYKGRSSISEVLKIDEKISSLILNGFNLNEIKGYLKTLDFKTLLDDGKIKVSKKETTLEQIYKVVTLR